MKRSHTTLKLTALLLAYLMVFGSVTSASSITFWVDPAVGGPGRKECHDELVNRFQTAYPDVSLEYNVRSTGPDSLLTAVAGGAGPDVAYLAAYLGPMYARDGLLVDIDPYLHRKGTHAEFMNDVFPLGLDGTMYDGRLIAFPMTGSTHNFFYNKDILNADGVPAPQDGWTWDDLESIARRLTRPDGSGEVEQWGLTFSNLRAFSDLHYTQAGGEYFTEDMERVAFRSEEGRKTATYMSGLISEHQVSPLANGSTPRFLEKRSGLHFDGNYRAPAVRDAEINAGVAPLISGDVKATTSGGWALGILNSNPEQEAAALQFAEFYSSPENQAFFTHCLGEIPVRQSAIPLYQEYIAEDPVLVAFAEMAQYAGRPAWTHPAGLQVINVWGRFLLQLIVEQSISLEAGLEELEREANNILREVPYRN